MVLKKRNRLSIQRKAVSFRDSYFVFSRGFQATLPSQLFDWYQVTMTCFCPPPSIRFDIRSNPEVSRLCKSFFRDLKRLSSGYEKTLKQLQKTALGFNLTANQTQTSTLNAIGIKLTAVQISTSQLRGLDNKYIFLMKTLLVQYEIFICQMFF